MSVRGFARNFCRQSALYDSRAAPAHVVLQPPVGSAQLLAEEAVSLSLKELVSLAFRRDSFDLVLVGTARPCQATIIHACTRDALVVL